MKVKADRNETEDRIEKREENVVPSFDARLAASTLTSTTKIDDCGLATRRPKAAWNTWYVRA